MINYEHAHNLFTNTNKPPRSKKYNANQRPLRRVSEAWLMLQEDNHSYAYIINGVEVARFFEPNEDGEYEVAIKGLYNTNDINLMWKFTGIHSGMTLETTTGEKVRVPLNHRYGDQDKQFSAFLTFNSSHQLVVEKSWHADIYRTESTAEDKQKRKDLKKAVEAYVTLQLFKLPTLIENCKPDINMGAPFGENNVGYSTQSTMRDALSNLPLPEESQAFMSAFDEVAQDCFNMLVSKRSYAADGGRALSRGYRSWYRSSNPAEADDAREAVEDIMNSITPDEFKKSLVTRLLTFANLKEGTRFVALPQFANTLPRRYYTTTR